MNYYRLYDDITILNRWYLGDINYENNWDFTNSKGDLTDNLLDLIVSVDRKGIELDYTETDAYSVPIVSKRLANLLSDYSDDIQLIPATVEGIKKDYHILNVKYKIECLDEKRSQFQKFEKDNEIRPDLEGHYEAVHLLLIDPCKVYRNIFRIDKYDIVIIVSELVKNRLEKAKLSGLKFKLVS